MNQRLTRHASTRAPVTPIHRGPQAVSPLSPVTQATFQHAPNAALLIDFDNVTMGIRSDLAGELRNLLGSEIIKGKVAVQRAYADWRRYPQYIVPLAEASIDMIMAPAYGTSKKNATDIRLSVDAMELVFTRSEIGTYILLSGDSDFASLVTKLKEYGKYVIGVGIRESSSDLLVMNCDEYYSYNALAGLVKAGEEEVVKWDPWELVTEAINRMVKNGDVMRSDRLKQVMQDIDPEFDEKNLGMSKFSRFCQEAQAHGLLRLTKLDSGQLEVSPPDEAMRAAAAATASTRAESRDMDRNERGRRGRRGGRGREREERAPASPAATAVQPAAHPAVAAPVAASPTPADQAAVSAPVPETAAPAAPTMPAVAPSPGAPDSIGRSGDRLTRDEAFALVRRAAASFGAGGGPIPAQGLRRRAFELLGRDSESLSQRFFERVLRDAHDADVIDLRRRGDDYEISLPREVAPISEQLNRAAAAHAPETASRESGNGSQAPAPRGMGPRGLPSRGRPGSRPAPPPELLSVGVVDEVVPAATAEPAPPAEAAAESGAATRPARKRGGGGRARTAGPAVAEGGNKAPASTEKLVKPRRPRAKKPTS